MSRNPGAIHGQLVWTINTALFPSVTGAEFSITGWTGSSGTWTYTPGAGDPGVTAWVAKGGPEFQLFYTIPKTAVLSGSWSTPSGQGLSHLTFYDSAPGNGGNGGDPFEVPAPGALAVLGVALLGLLTALRRRPRI